MKPTLHNLKKIVRKPYEPEPYARYFIRPLSILFTWLLVRTPITANQVTILQEIIGFAGVVFLAFGIPEYSLIAVLLLQLGYILDCSDGEVARWNNEQAARGVFLDLVGHYIIIPGYMFTLGLGVWIQTGRIEAVIAGFLAALFGLRLERFTLLSVVDTLITETETPQYNYEKLKLEIDSQSDSVDMGSAGKIARRSWFQVLFRYPDSMNIITIFVILSFIFPGVQVGDTFLPLTYFLIMVYGFVLFFGRLWQIKRAFSRNLVEKRFWQIIKIAQKIQTPQRSKDSETHEP